MDVSHALEIEYSLSQMPNSLSLGPKQLDLPFLGCPVSRSRRSLAKRDQSQDRMWPLPQQLRGRNQDQFEIDVDLSYESWRPRFWANLNYPRKLAEFKMYPGGQTAH